MNYLIQLSALVISENNTHVHKN